MLEYNKKEREIDMKKCLAMLLVCVLTASMLWGCGKAPEVNDNAQAAIQLLMTCPNPELTSVSAIGEGTTAKDDDGADGLEAALGPLVSDGYYDSFVSNGPDALFFLGTAELLSLTVEPTDIQLAEETEDGQTLQVTLQINGADTVDISVAFGLDKDVKLESMQILDDLGQLTQTLMGA